MKKNNEITLSPELELLLACCREENPQRLKKCCDRIDDWENFFKLTYEHGLLPVVYRRFSEESLPVPEDIFQDLKKEYRAIASQNFLMSAELTKIAKRFRSERIDFMALKGPILAEMLYGSISGRHFLDIDFIVRKRDIEKADKIMKELDYRPFTLFAPRDEEKHFRYERHLHYYHARTGVRAEMHWQLVNTHNPVDLNSIDIWKDRVEVTLNGEKLSTLSPENTFLFLAIHGSGHFWERISWLYDMAKLAERGHMVDWDYILKEANRIGARNMVLLCFHLLNRYFEIDVPPVIQEALSGSIRVKRDIFTMERYVLKTWKKEEFEPGRFERFKLLVLKSKMYSGLFRKYQFITKPKFEEYVVVELPSLLYWLYFPVRIYLFIQRNRNKNKNDENGMAPVLLQK